MSDKDMTKTLNRKVEEEVNTDEEFSPKFKPYWELFESAAEGMAIRTFYMRTEVRSPFYSNRVRNPLIACDIAAICDGLLIDLELATDYSNAKGGLTVLPLSAVGAVNFHPGGVQNLRDTQGASLTVTTGSGLYWFAKTDDERGYLMSFAQALIKSIGRR